MKLGRRALAMGIAGAWLSGRARAQVPPDWQPRDLELRDIKVPGTLSRRFTLLVPKHLLSHERVPLVVLLHGLGETIDERMGAYAWVERYGLGTTYDRLRRAPIARTTKRADLLDARVTELNDELAKRPFRGLVLACPFTPDLPIGAPGVIDDFARWITDVVVPRARAEAPCLDGPEHTTLGGCSLGGHFSLEVFTRRPEHFGGWGGVQTAISEAAAPGYAAKLVAAIAKAGPRDLFVESSTGDPFVRANQALARELGKKGIAHTLVIPPGPHDQPWLRESGTLEMLLWHDQRRRVERRLGQAL